MPVADWSTRQRAERLGGRLEVASGQVVCGHHVRHVGDRTDQVVVDARAFGQPLVATAAQLVEWGTTDQAQGHGQIRDAVGAARLSTQAQPAELVGVDQDILQLVDIDTAGLPGGGLQRIGQVLAAGAWVESEPGAAMRMSLRARSRTRVWLHMEPLEPMTIRGPTIGVQLLAPVVAWPLLLVLLSSAEEALYSMISNRSG